VGVEADQGGGLYLVSPEGPPQLLMPLGRPSAIAVAGNDRDLFVADRANRQIWELRDFREAATPLLFADDGGGMTDAVGLALSRDGKVLFVANQSAKTLDVYTLETRSLASRSSLDYEPSLLEPLSGPVLFLLKSVGNNNEPLLVLDTSREPTVYFVPVGRGE
jgi:sugar lactone lactonase YvrE